MARILVVDDTPQNVALIDLYLRGTEFEVVAATSGHEAVELCLKQSFTLILLDVVMRGIDGFEVCRRIKNDPRTAFVPVIFVTGQLGAESDRLAAYQLGAVDYIQKPINREELVARIRVMLRLEEARSRLDRENVALRREVEIASRALQGARRLVDGLQQLRQESAAETVSGLLVLDAQQRVLRADAVASQLIGTLAAGMPLAGQGEAGACLSRAIDGADGSAEVTLSDPRGGMRVVRLQVLEHLADGGRPVLLREVTQQRRAERRLQDRELLDMSPFRPAPVRPIGDYAMTDFVGTAASVMELADIVGRLRQSRSRVLIYGESGTGKELVARALHFDGQHRSAPFIPLHCGAIAPELVESELFGHEKGAFTGAEKSREGLFQAADGGTIFLDEIAEMSLAVQVKLLRVLQRGEIRPVGANQSRIVDVRILAATNRDLLQMVRDGRFREDLYHRLEVVALYVPPLRERMEDLPIIVEHFLDSCNRRHERLGRPVRGVSHEAMARLLAYPWPGNVRELENVVERAFALGVDEILQVEDLPNHVLRGTPELVPSHVWGTEREVEPGSARGREGHEQADHGPELNLRSLREASERQAISRALRDLGGDKNAAAQALGMSRSTFYRRIKELGF